MHWFKKDTVSCKQEIFSGSVVRSLSSKDDALFPELLAAPKFAIAGEKGQFRKSSTQLSFLLLFLFYLFLHACP